MDRRKIFKAGDSTKMKGKTKTEEETTETDLKIDPERRKFAALRELGNQLQIKAEKMRLLARAEEGLDDGDMNPYTSYAKPTEGEVFIDRITSRKLIIEAQADKTKIPSSNARQRRRDKTIKHAGHSAPGVDIRQYKPGYTWNRGGRVKELRIRNLARKFLNIWKKNVFGRITPSQARNHYRRRLLKLTFKAWHEMWWEVRKEWRLEVRAECHHRYVLWLKTYKAWRDFIVKQKFKNTKQALAEQHASCKLTRKCLDAWKSYAHSRQDKRMEKETADNHYNKTLLRSYWGQWVSNYELVLHRQHMESVSLQFWAYRIQAQHWLIWQAKLASRKASIQDQFRAVRHHNTTVVHRCLRGWIRYWAHRRQKKREKEYGFQIYQRHVVQTCFGQWLEAYRHKQALLEYQERIECLADRFQKRRFLQHWKHYVDLVHDKRETMELAKAHYVRKLKITGLSAFRLCVVQRKLKAMRMELASDLRQNQLIRGAWNSWLARCENNEELKNVTQSQKARKHYRQVLLRKSFVQLQRYCYWRQYRQSQYAKADAHYYMKVMPECLFRLKVFVQLMKNNRENQERAVHFRRENLHARFFYLWVNQFEFSKEYRMNERMAILHNEGSTLRTFFKLWKNRTAEVLHEAENEEIAAEYNNGVLRRNHFMAWLSYIRDIKKSQRQDIEASVHHHTTVMKKCLQAWIAYTRLRRVKTAKTVRAMQHYQRVLCRKMISMWLHYVDTQRCIKQRAELMYNSKCFHKLGEAFTTWRSNVSEQIRAREAEKYATNHHAMQVLAKVFKAWHRYSAIHAYKKSETRQWVASAREHLNLRVLELYFFKWRHHHEEHVAMRIKSQLAINHHSNQIKHKVIQIWKQYTQETVRKNLLQKQSDWFFKVRVTARCFMNWKLCLAASQLEKEKTYLALWNWCLGLQRKVFVAWMSYVQQRRHKRSLVHAAMERRRCRLVKTGLTQWLTVADDLASMRKTFAAQQQAKSAYETYQLVLRCGLHWKHWAAQQRQKHGGTKPLSRPAPHVRPHSDRGAYSASVTPREVKSSHTAPRDSAGLQRVTPREQLVMASDLSVIPKPILVTSPGSNVLPFPVPGAQEPRRPQLRARPRKPDFLVESLKRAGLYSPGSKSDQRLEPEPEVRTEDTAEVHGLDGNGVERLNLSNIDTDRSDRTNASSVPFRLYSGRGDIVSEAVTDRTDKTVTLSARSGDRPHSAKDLQPAQQNDQEPVHHDQPPGVAPSDQGGEFRGGDMYQMYPYFVTSNVPIPTNKFQLMTPADFLLKKDQSNFPTGADKIVKSDTSVVNHSNIHSESQSVASTPRIICQTSGHTHPLSETRSFRVGEFQPEITPRSTSSLATPRDHELEKLSSLGFESNTSSTQSIQKEIVVIRDRLKSFEQKKRKLRTMQKQLKQLSDWLSDMEAKGHRSDDEDVVNARQEVNELSADLEALKLSVEKEKIQCAGLVDRVKVLMSQLST